MIRRLKRKWYVFGQNMTYQRRKLFYPRDTTIQRVRIYTAIHRAGMAGLTRDQVVVATGIPLQTVTWRVAELLRPKYSPVVKPLLRETVNPERMTRQGGIAKVLFAI